jgi:cytidine deaminase
MIIERTSELSTIQKAAVSGAYTATVEAYSPYSNFSVGACLYTEEGQLFHGSNYENASYGLTMCAERVAIFAANVKGVRRFAGMAVICLGPKTDMTEFSGPCGACRQVLYEASQVSGNDLEILISDGLMEYVCVTSISELLPLAFGTKDLGVGS